VELLEGDGEGEEEGSLIWSLGALGGEGGGCRHCGGASSTAVTKVPFTMTLSFLLFSHNSQVGKVAFLQPCPPRFDSCL
jgi:hypothetical protein